MRYENVKKYKKKKKNRRQNTLLWMLGIEKWSVAFFVQLDTILMNKNKEEEKAAEEEELSH